MSLSVVLRVTHFLAHSTNLSQLFCENVINGVFAPDATCMQHSIFPQRPSCARINVSKQEVIFDRTPDGPVKGPVKDEVMPEDDGL